ncbi:unnamed protein product [Owenia fusiformis]|uniref:Uncharacterized protein n=1 Tax=Owenia fusiformis TaxID=6347 RepID=A0A8S4NLT3_OWEFU|nr:unnamed protein product [Owenia fusiformis]
MSIWMFCAVILLQTREQGFVHGDRCGNADCRTLSQMTVNGVTLLYCPEVILGVNCDERVQYFITKENQYEWEDDICPTLDNDLRYAIDSEDGERYNHMRQVSTDQNAWIGLRKTNPNTWANSVWIDGTAYSTTWNRWKDGSETTEHNCLEINGNDVWHAHDCTNEKHILCQKVYKCDDPFPHDDNAVITDLSVDEYYPSVKYRCNSGFFIGANTNIGEEIIQCRNSVWGKHTQCESPPCTSPPIDDFSTVSFSPASLVVGTITCKLGYSIGGGMNEDFSEAMECISGGVWNASHILCARRSCGPPVSYFGASVTYLETLYTDSAEYKCSYGYKTSDGVDSYTIECLPNATWSDRPKCEPEECGPTPRYENAKIISHTGTHLNDTVEFECNPGFEMDATTGETKGDILCQASGTWSELLGVCQRKNCGDPPHDSHAVTIMTSGTYFEDYANYTCSRGYRIGQNSTGTIHCQEDGLWAKHAPCLPVTCSDPPTDQYATITRNGLSYNDTILYTCHTGYYIDGHIRASNETLTCSEYGQWVPIHAPCNPVSCGNPIDDPHAKEVGDGSLYNDTMRYDCDIGYVLPDHTSMNSRNVSCHSNGQWSPIHAQCELLSCGTPIDDPHAKEVVNGSLYNDTMIYHCDIGYVLSDHTNMNRRNVRCNSNGQWSPIHAQCELLSCGNPIDDPHAKEVGDGSLYNDTMRYDCDIGYVLPDYTNMNSRNVSCHSNGQWSPIHAQCELLSCGNPIDDPHAKEVVNGSLYNDTMIYHCDIGYVLPDHTNMNSRNVRCHSNGQWSPIHAQCELLSCGNPIDDPHANEVANGSLYNDTMRYDCDIGYVLPDHTSMNSRNVSCHSNGQWSPKHAQCELLSCGNPIDDPHANEVANGSLYNDTMRYDCDIGYVLPDHTSMNSRNVSCHSNGQWSPKHAQCELLSCGTPIDDPYAVGVVNGVLYNDTVAYDCHIGYVLSDLPHMNSRRVSCLGDGTWERHELCTPIDCGPPMIDSNAYVNLSGILYNNTVRYDCRTGYRLGSSFPNATTYVELSCLSNGSWSYHIPCTRVACGQRPEDRHANVTASTYIDSLNSVDNQNSQSLVSNQDLFNDTLTYSCNLGYLINGTNETEKTISCTETGNWTKHNACVRRSCGPSPTDENAIVFFTDIPYLYGTMAVYQCNQGYWINGSTTYNITCQADGRWGHLVPCSIIPCGNPPFDNFANITLGRTILDNISAGNNTNTIQNRPFVYNDTLVYSCVHGYTIQYSNASTATITCGDGGQWSEHHPCVKANTSSFGCSCGTPDVDPNAIQSQVKTNYKCMDVVIFKCKDGYHVSGRSEDIIEEHLQCSPNATWSSRSYCISVKSKSWVRAKRVEYEPEEARGAALMGSVGLIAIIAMLVVVILSDIERFHSQIKLMLQNLSIGHRFRRMR